MASRLISPLHSISCEHGNINTVTPHKHLLHVLHFVHNCFWGWRDLGLWLAVVKLITHVLGILGNVAVKFPVVNSQLFDVYTREGKKLNI